MIHPKITKKYVPKYTRMNTYGKLIDAQTLQFERLLPGPIEKVWEYITEAEKRRLWFCDGTSGRQEGDHFTFVFHNSTLGEPPVPTPEKYTDFGDGYESQAVVVKAEKPTLFVIEWEGIVTFRLEEVGEQVLLTLTHEKLQDSKGTRVGTLAGWHTHLDLLMTICHGQKPESFWPAHMAHEDEYAKRVD